MRSRAIAPTLVDGVERRLGWRVPGAEYDLDPARIERQARTIANSPRLMAFASGLLEWARQSGEDMPSALVELAHEAQDVLTAIEDGN